MLVNNANIIEKSYRDLNILVGKRGMSFVVSDALNHKIVSLESKSFDSSESSSNLESRFFKTFDELPILSEHYDNVCVIDDSSICTFVPVEMFDQQFLGSYLQYSSKVFEQDDFRFDILKSGEMNNVYVAEPGLKLFFDTKFPNHELCNANSILVSSLLALSKNIESKKMYVHFQRDRFEMIIVQNQKLLLFNSFEYRTPEDIIYYVLFASEQLGMNPENFVLEFLGDIDEQNPYFEIVFKYVRDVSLMPTESLSDIISAEKVRANFILLQK